MGALTRGLRDLSSRERDLLARLFSCERLFAFRLRRLSLLVSRRESSDEDELETEREYWRDFRFRPCEKERRRLDRDLSRERLRRDDLRCFLSGEELDTERLRFDFFRELTERECDLCERE